MQSHADVIGAFGGTRPLAEAIGISPKRAIHWPDRGIPAKYWLLVEAAAAKRKIVVSANDLLRLSSLRGTEAA